MTVVTLVDTGPLVAMCDRSDKHHKWTVASLASVTGVLTTCEPVLAETCFLLKRNYGSADVVFDLLVRNLLRIDFNLGIEHKRVQHGGASVVNARIDENILNRSEP